MFSESEMARLRGFPEITTEELFRFFTLTAADETFVRSMRGSATTLVRQFTPAVLAAIEFTGGPSATELLEAVDVLRALNASGARTVPADAPAGFVPQRWAGYLDAARAAGDTTACRHYWELCVLGLRDGLRSGDVHVPGSRRYADPTAHLIPVEAWPAQREDFCALVDVPANPATAAVKVDTELHTALAELDAVLATGTGLVRLDEHGELVIGPLTAEDLPTEAAELRAELSALPPFSPLASVLVELDRGPGSWTASPTPAARPRAHASSNATCWR